VIRGCSSLEELYFRYNFNDFCREVTFPKLQRLYIDGYSGSEDIDGYWSPEDDLSLRCVSLVDNEEVFLSETTLKYCMQKAEVLRLKRIDGGIMEN